MAASVGMSERSVRHNDDTQTVFRRELKVRAGQRISMRAEKKQEPDSVRAVALHKHAVLVLSVSSHQVDDERRHENSQQNWIFSHGSDLGSRPDIIKLRPPSPAKALNSDPSPCRILLAENRKTLGS